MILITVQPQLSGTRVALRFAYNEQLVEHLKQMPGVQWDKRKFWTCPKTAFPVVQEHIESAFQVQWSVTGNFYNGPGGPGTPALIPIAPTMQSVLRPYQIDAVQRMLSMPGYALTFDPRVGKTGPTAAAIGSAMIHNLIDVAVVIYPAGVADEWKRQLPQFTQGSQFSVPGSITPTWPGVQSRIAPPGLHLFMLEGHKPLDQSSSMYPRNRPCLVIGCHWEILNKQLKSIRDLIGGRRYAVVADEIHRLRNRKSGLCTAAFELAHQPNCVYRWALTGTPMRNRPRDLWPTFHFLEKDSMGGYWSYAKRFCGAVENTYGWDDKGTAKEHLPELAARLAAVSYRLTRQDVAPWLPKSDDKMVICTMDAKTHAFYSAQERAFAPELQKVLGDHTDYVPPQSLAAMKRLAQTVVGVKIPTLVERVQYHNGDRGVKSLVFANYHETLQAAEMALRATATADVPIYCAGGWLSPEKRRAVIDAWKADPLPGVLLANTLSSGIGIDLAAAEVTIFLELSWVPADFLQTKARTENVHLQDDRSAPPLSEYLLVKNTVDQDMAMAMIQKFTTIGQVVGADASSEKTNEMLRGSGLVERSALGLQNEDPETVAAALRTLRARLLGITDASQAASDPNIALAIEVAESFDQEPESEASE